MKLCHKSVINVKVLLDAPLCDCENYVDLRFILYFGEESWFSFEFLVGEQ